jgi:DNA-3-methyladenine glycosylase I
VGGTARVELSTPPNEARRDWAARYFDPAIVASYGQKERESLFADAGIVRNRLKIEAAIQNAKAFLAVQVDVGTFDEYIWGFVGNEPRQNTRRSIKEVPAKTQESDAMSKDMKRRGFTFVGSTICYAFMQAVGMVNDHLVDCFRHGELRQMGEVRKVCMISCTTRKRSMEASTPSSPIMALARRCPKPSPGCIGNGCPRVVESRPRRLVSSITGRHREKWPRKIW